MSLLLKREVWYTVNDQEADELKAKGIPAGDIYTEWERRLLWELRDNPALVAKADKVKTMFYGTIHPESLPERPHDQPNSTIPSPAA